MSCVRPLFRAARMVPILAALSGSWAHGAFGNGITVVTATSPPPPEKESAPLKLPLSAENETKLKELTDKTREEVVKTWDLRMTKKIEEIAGVTGLGDEGKRALQPAAKQAVALFADSWSAKVSDSMRKVLVQQPKLAAMILEQNLSQVNANAMSDWVGDIDKPPDQEVWTKALHQTLSPDQAAAWDKAQAERKATIEKDIAAALKQNRDRMNDELTQQMLSACREIEASAGLAKERSDKLEDLAKSVAGQSTDLWLKRVEHVLLDMEDEQRQMFVKSGNIFVGMDENESPLKQAAWKEGVAGLLTADENKRLQVARDASKSKRARALGQIMIALLDEKIAFTESQRAKLQPITERLVTKVPELFPDNLPEGYYGYSPEIFFAAATGATDEELKPILDDIQLKHWRKLSVPEDAGSDQPKSKPDANAQPEDVEKAISSFLYEKTENERKRLLEASGLKVEDAARVVGLSAETRARLELAIRGEAEQTLTTWKWFIEQQIRSQLQEATPQNIRQRLDGIQDFIFQQRFFFGGRMGFQGSQAKVGIWEKTVDVELNQNQKDAWKKETDARAAFHDNAIAGFVMAEFDRKNQLTADQWTKLEPMISGLLHDRGPDIAQVFSSNNPWYMEGPYTLLPFAGVPEADLKAILTKDQWDRWHGSQENANSANLWQNIEQMHKQRAGGNGNGGVITVH